MRERENERERSSSVLSRLLGKVSRERLNIYENYCYREKFKRLNVFMNIYENVSAMSDR